MPPDRPRFLDKRPGHSYTENPVWELRGAGEPVPVEYQDAITAAAHRARADAQRAEWELRRLDVERALDWLYSQRNRRNIRGEVRALQRQLQRLDRKIGS